MRNWLIKRIQIAEYRLNLRTVRKRQGQQAYDDLKAAVEQWALATRQTPEVVWERQFQGRTFELTSKPNGGFRVEFEEDS